MKKLNLLFFFTFLLYFILTTSCDKTKILENTITFDSIQINDSYYINNDKSQPGCNIKINFSFPDSTSNKSNLLKVMIEKTLGKEFENTSPQKATIDFIDSYIVNFKHFISATENSEYKEDENIYEDETGYSYYIVLKNKIVYNKNNFVSFTVETLSYEGGAHSSKAIRGYVYNLTTDKLLKEDDFSGNRYENNISLVLAKKIAETNELENINDLENLGYNNLDEIKPNNNFTLDDKGITYYFNENDIAGTMVGITEVFIPYEELAIYIQKDSPISSLIVN